MELYDYFMIKKGNLRVGIVANEKDQAELEYLIEKLGLKPTQVYRLALHLYYRSQLKED